MPVPYFPAYSRSGTLRAVRYGDYDDEDRIVSKMGQVNLTARKHKHILGRPQTSWSDDYDPSGKHYSRRRWRIVKGELNAAGVVIVDKKRERRFRYDPAIPWEDNPAYWDQEMTIEIELDLD